MYPGRLEEIIHPQEKRISSIKYREDGNPSFLPVYLTGGIGDAILAIRTLRHLKAEGFQMLIYSQHAEALRYFYKDQTVFKGYLPDFTWCLHLDSIARFKFTNKFNGFLLQEHKKLFDQQQQWFRENPVLEYLVREHPKYKYVLTRKMEELGIDAKTLAVYSLGYKSMIGSLHPERKKEVKDYITIHDGYDVNNLSMVSGRSTKQWKWEHWNHLVQQFRKEYPTTRVIQLGTKTARIIDGISDNLVNKTTLTEAFDILAHSKLHIDTDSGLVHAATALGVPTIVLFGPTPDSFYGHKQNVNLRSMTSCKGSCFFVTQNWMDKCPIGYVSPQCMDDIYPSQVMEKIKGLLF